MMSPLLKNLLGNGPKDQELAEEMRALLHKMQTERHSHEKLLQTMTVAADRLSEMGEPIAKASKDVDSVVSRLETLETRIEAMSKLASQLEALDERAHSLAQSHQDTSQQVANTLDDAQRIREVFEELSQKVDIAVELKSKLESFMEIDKPFQQIGSEAEALRGQIEGTAEHLARLRDQQDRLMDTHKLSTTKMEALDRRRDDLGRELSDKERRIAIVEQAVRGMDGIQNTVAEIKREIGAVKAMGDNVVQKAAALEAQREAVDRALAQAESLERAMRQIEVGVRQQQDNEKTLAGLHESALALKSLHESVVERSDEISRLQHETNEQVRASRQDLMSVTDEMKKTVERFDFESRGLESVSQRVADMRSSLSDCENRFKALVEPSHAVAGIESQAQVLTATLQTLTDDVGKVDREIGAFLAIRRDLDEAGRATREIGAKIDRIEDARPTIEATLRELEQLRGAYALVKDSREQTQIASDELARVREGQSETRSWLSSVEQLVGELRDQVSDLYKLTPTIDVVQKQAQRVIEYTTAIESRREFIDDMHRRMTDLGALGSRLDERDRQLQSRMEAAEQRFVSLAARADETERLNVAVANVTSQLTEADHRTEEITKAVFAIGERCQSIENLAEQTRALRPELEQRQHALDEAAQDLNRVSELRQEAANSAQQLDELAQRLSTNLGETQQRVTQMDELATQLEARSANLRTVEQRLTSFEKRLAQWDPVEKEIARSLEQIVARQGTVESVHADLDRMSAMAETTAANVREITSAYQDVEQSKALLVEVMERLKEVRDSAKSLDERQRQMTKAEERLARAEALLTDVRSSLESLQGQKAIVDQAVEKAGSLRVLLKQADATIEGLREEREMTTRVRSAMAVIDSGDDDEDIARAA